MIGPISPDVKQMGARSAGNPHAACDVEGAGNVARSGCLGQLARQSSTLPGKAVLRSLIAPQVSRRFSTGLESLRYWVRLGPVANRRAPRATRSALTSDGAARVGGACLPTGASRGGTQCGFEHAASSRGHGSFRGLPDVSEPQRGVGEAGTAMSRARSTP